MSKLVPHSFLNPGRWFVFALVAVLASAVVLVLSPVNASVTPDSAEFAMKAQDMVEQGTPFPATWHDSTCAQFHELIVGAAHLVCADYEVAGKLASCATVLLTVLAFLFFMRVAVGSGRGGLLLPIAFFTLWSDVHFMYFCSSCFYSQFIVGLLLLFGLFLYGQDSGSGDVGHHGRRWAALLIVAVFAVNAALGIRMALQATVPMAVAAFFLLKGRKRVAVGLFVAGMVGDVVYKVFTARLFGVEAEYASFMSVFASDGWAVIDNLGHFIWGLFRRLGFPGGKPLMSVGGAVGAVRFAVAVVTSLVLPALALREFKSLPFREKFLLIVGITAFVETFGVLVFCTTVPGDEDDSCARYLAITLITLSWPGILYAWRKFAPARAGLQRLVIVSVMAFSLSCNLAAAVDMARVHRPAVARINAFLQLLKSEGLEYGYAPYRDSSQYTFHSNGRIAVRPVFIEKDVVLPQRWLSSESWYDPKVHAGPTFLALADSELQRLAPGGIEDSVRWKPARTIRFGDVNVLVYDFNVSQLFGRAQ